jgi:hypothetical protein
MGLVAIVAVQGRPDLGARPHRARQLTEQGQLRLGVGGVAGVELPGQGEGPLVVGGQLGVVGDVRLAGEHPLPLAAPIRRFWCLVAHGMTVPIGSSPSPNGQPQPAWSAGDLSGVDAYVPVA